MSKETYSIPAGPTARYDFQRNAISLCKASATAWSIPEAILTAIAPLATTYELKYSVANNKKTQSPTATAARDAAWSLLEPSLTDLYDKHIINNDLIAIADKTALHVHFTGSGAGFPAPAPSSTPIITLVSEEISILHVVYADSEAPSTHYKPANVAFCELCYKIGDTAPVSIAECTERYNIARSHEGMVFTPQQRGKNIYTHGRWVNKNGKLGPWSNLVSAMIP